MIKKQRTYLSYMLRLWQTFDGKDPVWRASLENPHTGERLTFKNLERLFAFLDDQCSTKDPEED